MLANNFSTSTCFAIYELMKFMCFGSTLSYPHKEFLNPRPQQVQPALTPQQIQPAPARIAVQTPTPAPQMWVPTTRTG